MQKLDWKNTYTPLDSIVRGNCDSLKNEILKSLHNFKRNSVPNLKTLSNSFDENLPVSKIRGGFILTTDNFY